MKLKFRFKNRKIKFREADYIEKHYIKDGKAVIPIFLKSIDDLYMKHDYIKLALSDDLCDYIEEIAYIIPLKYDIVLEIHCPEISEKEQIRIKKVIKNNYGMEIDDIDYDLNKVNARSWFYGIVGIAILVFNLLTEKIREVSLSVLPITLIVIILNFTLTPIETSMMIRFIIGAIFVVIGLSIFLVGVDSPPFL